MFEAIDLPVEFGHNCTAEIGLLGKPGTLNDARVASRPVQNGPMSFEPQYAPYRTTTLNTAFLEYARILPILD